MTAGKRLPSRYSPIPFGLQVSPCHFHQPTISTRDRAASGVTCPGGHVMQPTESRSTLRLLGASEEPLPKAPSP